MIKNLKLILDKDDLNKIIFIFLLNFFVAILEFFSIGSIPILANLVINFDSFVSNLQFESLKNFISSYSLREVIVFSFFCVVGLFFLKNIAIFLIILYEEKFYKNINYKLSKTFFNYYINSKFEFHAKNKPSELASNIDNEIEYSVSLINYICLLSRDLLIVIILTALLMYANFKVTISILIIFLITILIFYLLVRSRLKSRAKKNVSLREEIIQLLNESFGSIKELKVYKKIPLIKRMFENKTFEFQNNRFFFKVSRKIPRLLFEVVAITFLLLIFLYFFINTNDYQSFIPILSLLIVTFVRFIPAFNSIAISLNMIRVYTPSLKKISNQMSKMSSNKDFILKEDDISNLAKNKDQMIKFDNIDFMYSGNDFKTIDNLSLKINGGDHIGIIGTTGSGKSTFINLLLGLLKPSSGTINVKNVIKKNLLSSYFNVGYVSQNVFLQNTSIKKNILFNFDEEHEKINIDFYDKILKITLLDDFISKCPLGDETLIGDNAINISGGQKQRIAIARAIINDPDILILDEATNALDYKTEDLIMNNLSASFKSKILIVIGHRPGVLKRCNKIYQMQNGKLSQVEGQKLFDNFN